LRTHVRDGFFRFTFVCKMQRPILHLKTILRVSNGVVFIISLPLLLLAFFYAGETVFWNEGPATDYPLLQTPRPTLEIRFHGLLCLVAASACTGITGIGMATRSRPGRLHQMTAIAVHSTCLACIWWNPWNSGPMEDEELQMKVILSSMFLVSSCMHTLYSISTQQNPIDRKNNPTPTE
jgi:hypothetical protein